MMKIGIKSGINGEIYYSKPFNFTFEKTDNRLLRIELDESEERQQEKERLSFTWKVSNHTEKEMGIELLFKYPKQISKSEVDKLMIFVENTQYMIGASSEKQVRKKSIQDRTCGSGESVLCTNLPSFISEKELR